MDGVGGEVEPHRAVMWGEVTGRHVAGMHWVVPILWPSTPMFREGSIDPASRWMGSALLGSGTE